MGTVYNLAEIEIQSASEAFSSASARDIWPIAEIKMLDGSVKTFPTPGKITTTVTHIFNLFAEKYKAQAEKLC